MPPGAFSAQAVGTTGAQFLENPFGARAAAMGGAWAAAARGAEAFFQNPAALAAKSSALVEAAFGYDALLGTSYQGSGAYARHLSYGTVAAGFIYAAQAPQTAFDARGNSVGSFTPMDMAAGAGYAGHVGALRLGATFKLIRSVLSDRRANDFAADAGMIMPDVTELGSGVLDVGAAFSNLGPPIKLGPTSDPLPLSVRGGFLWRASPTFNAALDAVFPVNDAPYAALGVELLFPLRVSASSSSSAALRAGYDSSRATGIDGFTGASFGLGLDWAALRLDYAWVPFGNAGDANRVTLAFRF